MEAAPASATYGQTLDVQLEQLRADGCTRIYREKASGAKPDRRELLRLLNNLATGDVVTVTRIDRLARSTFDLFAIVKRIRTEEAILFQVPAYKAVMAHKARLIPGIY